jgi:rubredoxin
MSNAPTNGQGQNNNALPHHPKVNGGSKRHPDWECTECTTDKDDPYYVPGNLFVCNNCGLIMREYGPGQRKPTPMIEVMARRKAEEVEQKKEGAEGGDTAA